FLARNARADKRGVHDEPPCSLDFSIHGLRAGHDAFHDVVIAGAAAEVAFQRLADFLLARVGVALREVERVHHHARGAEAALQAMVLFECRLHRVQRAIGLRHALDGHDVGALGLHRDDRAALDRLAVHQDGARAALGGVASHVGAGQAQVLANVGNQQGSRLDLGGNGLAIDLHGYFERHAGSPREKYASAAVSSLSMRLLIVEDDAPLASGLRRMLEAEGYAVDVTGRGEEAVLAASQERFDLVILDIGLPQMDGFEVLRRLRAAEKPMPVLVLTARDAVDDRVRGLDLGADDYMAKPFAMPELTARVRALLRRSQAHGDPRIVHGPLAIDTVARRAFLRGEPLELAAREWAVLEVLLAKVEKIVSKEAIIQAVAGWGDDLSPNAIEVYISRLRSKLEPAGIRIR